MHDPLIIQFIAETLGQREATGKGCTYAVLVVTRPQQETEPLLYKKPVYS